MRRSRHQTDRVTAPVPLQAGPSSQPRLAAGWRDVDEALVGRLRSACHTVDTEFSACTEWARDWWPLALSWAAAGSLPARAGAVAHPTDAGEVAAVLAICNEVGMPVTPAAGRSGVCGSSVPVSGGVVLDLCALSGIRDVDDRSLTARVGAGTFGHHLEAELRERHGVTLGHWPQSVELSTVGGWLACRSAGQYSTRYGKIEDMVREVEVVTADGRRLRLGGRAPRSATGPDLVQLIVGSEGTLAVITEAELSVRTVPATEARAAFVFEDFRAGLEACRMILRRGATPAVLRLYDGAESVRSFEVDTGAVMIVLDEGDPLLVDATAAIVATECANANGRSADVTLVERWLGHRNDVSALGALISRGFIVDTVEVAGRWAVLGDLYGAVVGALRAIDGTLTASAHQSHAYVDGACLYFTFAARPSNDADAAWAERYYTAAWRAVMTSVIEHGAAVSHHHGIGVLRGEALKQSLGPSHELLTQIKGVLDPNGILNPGKLGLASPFGPPAWRPA